MIFDEPTSGLDGKNLNIIAELFTKVASEGRVAGITEGYRLPMILFQTLLASLSFIMIYGGILMLPSSENILSLFIDLV